MNEFDEQIIVALKEAEHRYQVTGMAQGITKDLDVEEWSPHRTYVETVGVNVFAQLCEICK